VSDGKRRSCRSCATQRGGRTFTSPRRPGFRARQALCDPDFLLAARHRLRVVARRSLAALGGATSRLQRVIASSREDEKRRPGGTRIPSRGSERDLASLPSSHPVRPTSNTHLKTASLRFSRLCTIFLQLALSRNWSSVSQSHSQDLIAAATGAGIDGERSFGHPISQAVRATLGETIHAAREQEDSDPRNQRF
jgi:hypothetical protein